MQYLCIFNEHKGHIYFFSKHMYTKYMNEFGWQFSRAVGSLTRPVFRRLRPVWTPIARRLRQGLENRLEVFKHRPRTPLWESSEADGVE